MASSISPTSSTTTPSISTTVGSGSSNSRGAAAADAASATGGKTTVQVQWNEHNKIFSPGSGNNPLPPTTPPETRRSNEELKTELLARARKNKDVGGGGECRRSVAAVGGFEMDTAGDGGAGGGARTTSTFVTIGGALMQDPQQPQFHHPYSHHQQQHELHHQQQKHSATTEWDLQNALDMDASVLSANKQQHSGAGQQSGASSATVSTSGGGHQQFGNQEEGHKPPYTLSGVLHFLQSEWTRVEQDRAQWEMERAEFTAKINLLVGERRGQENLKKCLVRRIKMLEYALRQERAKMHQLTNKDEGIPEHLLVSPPTDSGDEEGIAHDSLMNNSGITMSANNKQQDGGAALTPEGFVQLEMDAVLDVKEKRDNEWEAARKLIHQYLREINSTEKLFEVRTQTIKNTFDGFSNTNKASELSTDSPKDIKVDNKKFTERALEESENHILAAAELIQTQRRQRKMQQQHQRQTMLQQHIHEQQQRPLPIATTTTTSSAAHAPPKRRGSAIKVAANGSVVPPLAFSASNSVGAHVEDYSDSSDDSDSPRHDADADNDSDEHQYTSALDSDAVEALGEFKFLRQKDTPTPMRQQPKTFEVTAVGAISMDDYGDSS